MDDEIKKTKTDEFIEMVDEVPVFRWLRIKYNNTEENRRTDLAFREYAKKYHDDSYLQALKHLLQNASTDWKYDSLYSMIIDQQDQLQELSEKVSAPVKEESRTF